MKSTLLKSPALFDSPEDLGVSCAVIKGAGTVETKKNAVLATFSDTDINNVASCFIEKKSEYSAEINLQFTKNSKQMLFFRMEHFTKADVQIHIQAEEGSEVFFVFLAKNDTISQARLKISGEVQQNAMLHLTGLHANEGKFVGEFSVEMLGENAKSHISIIEIGHDSGTSDIQIENITSHSNAIGEIKTRAMLFDTSSSRIQGVPVVNKGANNCQNHLNQKTLLLSPKARSESIPLLSIANNEVSASHSSSMARLTDDDLFYFQSRGVSKESAQKLLLDGFLTEILSEIPEESVQRCMSEMAQHFLES